MIPRRSPDEIEAIRAACLIVSQVHGALAQRIAPGVSTATLDALAEETIRSNGGAEPAFKGYHGFPASICASVNDEAVHGFPRPAALEEGDVLCVDVGVRLNGWYGDGAFTLAVGDLDPDVERLLQATLRALEAGVQAARPGNRVSDISHAVEQVAREAGVAVIREYGGHGIGRELHEEPHIPNHGAPGRGPRLQAGQVVAIEPIFSLGAAEVVVDEDGWTTRTKDGSAAAHFEHTVAITEAGPCPLTLPQAATLAAIG
ncbi:MAG: type I methionyl aminopeptidase [Gemmatimonadetes bacterium]|nr:type I methionyl aminopeptidase [Gemmatimonadota bacterium]MBT7859632.1 type I methionyl aminopeptidase [Gemmatimonadota bacterium]